MEFLGIFYQSISVKHTARLWMSRFYVSGRFLSTISRHVGEVADGGLLLEETWSPSDGGVWYS
jgi:hypothetical protein